MDYKELKIQEIANIWGVSVTTTWNRIKKEGLTTFKKKDQTGKEVSYVTISDDILSKYVNNVNNNDFNNNNNRYYEELLTNNNRFQDDNNIVDVEIIRNNTLSHAELVDKLTTLNNGYNDRLKEVYDDYKLELKTLYDELITYKSKSILLTDSERQSDYYIKEIKGLKTDNNQLMKTNNLLKYVIMGLITVIVITFTWLITVNNISKPVTEQEPVIETVAPKIVQPTPTEAKAPVKAVKKR